MARRRRLLAIGCAVVASAACASAGSSSIAATDAATESISDSAPVPSLVDSLVVCRTCSPSLVDAKREGIGLAMRRMLAFVGNDVLPRHAPLTFHLDGDDACGTAEDMERAYGYLTGFSYLDGQGKGECCLFDVEKPNRALPFTPENARSLLDQLLPLHEAMHIWFCGRLDDERIVEPFAKMTSLVVSGTMSDPCASYRVVTPPDSLIAALCDVGLSADLLPQIFQLTAAMARADDRPLTNLEFCTLLTVVLGRDARPTFAAFGLL